MWKSIDIEGLFTTGTEVEVWMKRTGYRGSWYEATVITPPASAQEEESEHSNRKVATVEYKNIMEEDGITRVRETVDAWQLRPLPPRAKEEVFGIRDGVDAWLVGGWWRGKIENELDEEGMVFEVYFKDLWRMMKLEKRIIGAKRVILEAKDLRIQREWYGGSEWVPPVLENETSSSESVDTQNSNA